MSVCAPASRRCGFHVCIPGPAMAALEDEGQLPGRHVSGVLTSKGKRSLAFTACSGNSLWWFGVRGGAAVPPRSLSSLQARSPTALSARGLRQGLHPGKASGADAP